jgi:hypothetical protein
MSVELTNLVNGTIRHRAQFIITHLHDNGWRVQVILRAAEASRYDIRTTTVATEAEAMATVHHQLGSYFLAVAEEDVGGDKIIWQVAAPQDTPPQFIELAMDIAAGVDEDLAGEVEEQEIEAMRRRGEPITWGLVDYDTGEVTPQYTEYPGQGGKPTRRVFMDGTVEYRDEEDDLVDEQGHPITEGEAAWQPRSQAGDEA